MKIVAFRLPLVAFMSSIVGTNIVVQVVLLWRCMSIACPMVLNLMSFV